MVGRVLVNNQDITGARSIMGEVDYATIGSVLVRKLPKGTNTVQPQYRTPANSGKRQLSSPIRASCNKILTSSCALIS